MASLEIAIQKYSENAAHYIGIESYRVVEERDALAGSESGLFGEIRSIEDERVDDNCDGLNDAGEDRSDAGSEDNPCDVANKHTKCRKNGSGFPVLDGGQVVNFAFRSRI